MISEPTLRTKLVEKIQAIDQNAKVYRRRRYPAQNRIKAYTDLFIDEDKRVNGYMIRRLRRTSFYKSIPGRLDSVTHVYAIRFYYSIKDTNEDQTATEGIVDAKIEALCASFDEDIHLGFGTCVRHNGLQMPTDFEDILFGDWPCHRADFRIEINVKNANCEVNNG